MSASIKPTYVNVLDFGAKCDGKTINTEAINNAIKAAIENESYHVVVPPGEYLSGTIFLHSNVTLEIMTGAMLKASPDINDFPIVPRASEGVWKGSQRNFIYAVDAHHVKICGGGTIDGNVAAFSHNYDTIAPYTWTWHKSDKERYHPMMEFRDCSHVRLEGITIQNSASWTCHLWCCNFVWITGVKLYNYVYAGNADGFDMNGCRDVIISGCHIETADDAIVFKAMYGSRSTERVTVTNCIIRTSCAALRLGAETWYDYRHITFSNSVIYCSTRAVDITSQDGAVIEDISISNLVIDTDSSINMNRAIHLELRKGRGEWDRVIPYDEQIIGKIRRVNISNIVLNTDGRILLTATDGGMLENIVLRDINMSYPWIEDPVDVDKLSDQFQSSNYNPVARLARAAVVVENARNFQLHGLNISWPSEPVRSDFQGKYEHGKLVADPKTDTRPQPKFHAFWGNNLQGGMLDIPMATASEEGVEVIHLEDSTIRVRE